MTSENFIQWIDADRVQALLESFHRLTGIPSALLARDGEIVTGESGQRLAVGWQRICVDFHRQHPLTLERCRESDTRISNRLEAGDRYTCYECLNGLVDAAVPVVVDGEHVLTLFTGQFFFEPPDRERFRRQAAELGFDEEDYLAALDEVPVMSRETVEQGMTFLTHLAELVGELAQGRRGLIARRKQAEETLLEYHRVVEQSDDLVGVVDRSSTYRLVNRAFLKQLGLEREEVVGRTVVEVMGEKDYGVIGPYLERAFAGEPVEYEMVFDHAEGPRTLLSRYDPIRAESGEVVLVVGVIRDITNQRKAERELESFFNLSMDMLCVAGFDGYFKRLNPAWERTLGWTEEELLGSPWIDFVHPDDVQPTLDAGEALTEGREIASFENRYRCKDGTLRWLSWNSRPLLEQGLMYAVVRDVTAAKEAEAALRDRDRLQGALETAGAVCHELNQPLQTITGFADLLLLEVMDQEGPSEKARRIQEAVRLINSITKKLSGITRYQTMDYFRGRIVDIDRSSDPVLPDDTP